MVMGKDSVKSCKKPDEVFKDTKDNIMAKRKRITGQKTIYKHYT